MAHSDKVPSCTVLYSYSLSTSTNYQVLVQILTFGVQVQVPPYQYQGLYLWTVLTRDGKERILGSSLVRVL